jgi:hypothetical protein
MIRTGETVAVPIRFSLIRCGMSEPVTNTVRSFVAFLFCERCSTGLSANAVPVSIMVMTLATHLEKSILMTYYTAAETAMQNRTQLGGRNPNSACNSPQSQSTNQSFRMDAALAVARASAFSTLPFKQ